MWPNPQFPADLVIFTVEILNGILHFLCSAWVRLIIWGITWIDTTLSKIVFCVKQMVALETISRNLSSQGAFQVYSTFFSLTWSICSKSLFSKTTPICKFCLKLTVKALKRDSSSQSSIFMVNLKQILSWAI